MITLAVLLMAGCSNDNEMLDEEPEVPNETPETPNEEPTTTGITIQATINNGATSRVALETSNTTTPILIWTIDDYIYLSDSNWEMFTFKATSVEGDGTTATFTSVFDNAPETLPDGPYTAECGVHNASKQEGTRENVARYVYMTASCTVENGESYEGLSLDFAPQSPIVHATLKNEAFKNNDVTNVRFVCTGVDECTFTATETFAGKADGTIEVYFAVTPSCLEDSYNYAIQAKCGGTYYEVSLGKKHLEAGKLYHVKDKEMTEVTSAATLLNLKIAEAEDDVETTIELTGDIEVTGANEGTAAFYIPNGKNIIIDGKGKTISIASLDDYLSIFYVVGSLTLKNITVDADKDVVNAIFNAGNITLGEGATVKCIITNMGTLTLESGSSVTYTTDRAIDVSFGGTVTFNGGTVSGKTCDILINTYYTGNGYIPLVCNAKPTAEGSALRLYMATETADSQTIATVNYDNASANDFGLYEWQYDVYSEPKNITEGATFSISDGKLILTPDGN